MTNEQLKNCCYVKSASGPFYVSGIIHSAKCDKTRKKNLVGCRNTIYPTQGLAEKFDTPQEE